MTPRWPADSETPESQCSTPVKNIIVLVDHDNIKEAHAYPSAVVTASLDAIPDLANAIYFTMRAYGGWFEGTSPTESRYQTLLSYQEFCLALIQTSRA